MCKVAPVAVEVAIPVANSAVDCGIQADLSAKGVKHGTPVNARHSEGGLVDLECMGPLWGLHCRGDDGVKLHSGLADGHQLESARYEQVVRFRGSSSLDVGGGHSQQGAAPHNLERDGGLKRGSTCLYAAWQRACSDGSMRGVQQEQPRQWTDKSNNVDGLTKEVLTECNDDRDTDGQDNDSGALATESAVTSAARGQRLEEVDKESDGKDYDEQEVDPNSQLSSAL